jgi:Domain of unknown function (DUF3854)/Family of unknown function (DUF5906)
MKVSPKQAGQLMEADLARSGLTPADAKQFGLKLLRPSDVEKMAPPAKQIWAYIIPYSNKLRGTGAKQVFRLRALTQPELPFGAEYSKDNAPPKYWQGLDTPPAAYIPPTADMVTAINELGRLLLVEGEKKAIKGNLAGFPTIGLGGVWSWKSGKLGWALLPELAAIEWKGRHVYICFDSDAGEKADVARAILALQEELTKRGAMVHVATVPEVKPGEKAGLDDFLVAKGPEAWEDVLQEATVSELPQRLWKFNARYACIEHPTVVVDEGTFDLTGRPCLQIFSDVARFKLATGNQMAADVHIKPDGERTTKPVRVADKWLEWQCRRSFQKIAYEPGQPRELNQYGTRFNVWAGLGIDPKKGNIKPWRELLDHVFRDSPREHRHWFECWCAWPLRHLGAKLPAAVGFWGKPGRGKSLFAEKLLGPIYGQNFISISQAVLEDGFTDWAANRQFVLVDEVTATDSRARADVFKKYTTQKEMQVNTKFIPRYAIIDHVNYFLTSNSPRAFFVEDDDRRFFIHHVPDESPERKFFDNLLDVWAPGGGLAALLYYFQHDFDFGKFDPNEPPPVTVDKEEMIEASRHPIDDWLRAFCQSEHFKVRGGRQVYELGELCSIYINHRNDKHVSPNAFGVHIRNAGLLKRKLWHQEENVAKRLVAVCHVCKWRDAPPKAWFAELIRGTAQSGGTF